jgi:CRP-like cAMP-binding protein
MSLSKEEEDECVSLLRNSVLLRHCREPDLRKLAKRTRRTIYKKGDILSKEGEPQEKMFLLSLGSVVREKVYENGQIHRIDTMLGGQTVGSLHILNKDPSYATTRCTSDVVVYELASDDLKTIFTTNPSFAFDVAHGLSMEIRRHTKAERTPLLEQQQRKSPILAVSIAAGVESFYRSALNVLINQALTGVKAASFFPNMHIQLPTRIVYINGFKQLRGYLDAHIKPEEYAFPNAVRLGAAITPGLIMTPVSSILEASVAGNSNPESMWTRWTRGLVPRAGREVIFGVGLNQLSDYFEERVPYIENPVLKNAAGSLAAGVVSGYFSHVVHNLSTLKLTNPSKSYKELFREYCKKSEARLPQTWTPQARSRLGTAAAVLFPAGCLIRTTQIVGSFIILNGTIAAVSRWMVAKKPQEHK